MKRVVSVRITLFDNIPIWVSPSSKAQPASEFEALTATAALSPAHPIPSCPKKNTSHQLQGATWGILTFYFRVTYGKQPAPASEPVAHNSIYCHGLHHPFHLAGCSSLGGHLNYSWMSLNSKRKQNSWVYYSWLSIHCQLFAFGSGRLQSIRVICK